jgi:hypothetical protein
MKSAIIDKTGLIQVIFDFTGEPDKYPLEKGNKLLVGIEDYITFNYKWNGSQFEKIDNNIKGPNPIYIKEI